MERCCWDVLSVRQKLAYLERIEVDWGHHSDVIILCDSNVMDHGECYARQPVAHWGNSKAARLCRTNVTCGANVSDLLFSISGITKGEMTRLLHAMDIQMPCIAVSERS